MIRNDLYFQVIRQKISHNYKFSDEIIKKRGLNKYQANTKHNMLDFLRLCNSKEILFCCLNVQTVSNHPDMKYGDTIKQGEFKIKCFVDQRNFNTQIHGIINAYDLDDQKIDKYSMQMDCGNYIGRWLIHSSFYTPLGRDTRGYSGGCFIMSTLNMKNLNLILINNGIKSGDIIPGWLRETGE